MSEWTLRGSVDCAKLQSKHVFLTCGRSFHAITLDSVGIQRQQAHQQVPAFSDLMVQLLELALEEYVPFPKATGNPKTYLLVPLEVTCA